MPMSATQASRNIASTDAFREIVQQVRSGQKSNAEMFEALRELARKNVDHSDQKHSGTPQQARAHEAPDALGGGNVYANSVQLAKFSPEDRKKLVSKIVEQRRNQQRRRNQSWVPGSSGRGVDSDHPRVAAAMQDLHSQSDTMEPDDAGASERLTDDNSSVDERRKEEEREELDEEKKQQPRQQQHQHQKRHDSEVDAGSTTDSSMDPDADEEATELEQNVPQNKQQKHNQHLAQPQFSDEWDAHVDVLVEDEEDRHIRRTASMYMMGSQKFREAKSRASDDNQLSRSKIFSRSLLDIKQEMWKDCTFKPSIKKLPSYYGPKKEGAEPFYDRVMRWSQTREHEVEQKRQKSAQKELVGCTFTPKLNANSKRAVEMSRADTELSASERLYKQIEVIKQNKQRNQDQHERKQREAEEKACTFKPRLVSTPKYRQSHQFSCSERSRNWTEKSRRQDDNPELTFHPKIKGVKDNMTAAWLYTGTPVVERLTRNYAADDSMIDDATLDRPSMDAKSFIGSLQGNRPRSAPHSRGSRELTPAEQQQRQRAFQMFLARQNHTLVRKGSKVKELAEKQKASFQPQLCQRSLDMTEEQNMGSFLGRLERDRLKREHDAQRKAIMSQAVSHSFKPELTKKSALLRARSVHEMSKGDLMKKETNQRLLRLRMEQAQLEEMTFKPRISAAGQANNGKLRLSASTEHYLATIKAMQQRKREKAFRAQQQREADELQDCTFTPETIDCPTYIQRISQSMKIAKAMRSTDETPARPDWR